MSENINENHNVVQHNKLIEAQGRLSLLEQKFFLGVVSQIRKGDEDFKEYKITIDEMVEVFGMQRSSVHRVAKETADRLMCIPIRIEDEEGWLRTNLFSSARYVNGESYVRFSFDPNLKPYLLHLQSFTQYQLKNIARMDSAYSIRIYELLKQYQNMKTRGGQTVKRAFELEELKMILGIEKTEYSRFFDFEKRVLKVATDEINEKSDIQIGYTKKRIGRRIGIIEFEILNRNEKKEYNDSLGKARDQKSLKTKMGMADADFSNQQVEELYEIACANVDYDHLTVYEYARLNYNHAIEKKPRHLFGYLKKALEQDFALANDQMKLEYYEGE